MNNQAIIGINLLSTVSFYTCFLYYYFLYKYEFYKSNICYT